MTQEQRLHTLITYLWEEDHFSQPLMLPSQSSQQKRLLRSLMNLREPKPIDTSFLEIQNRYLQEELRQVHVTSLKELTPTKKGIYLWQGDITKLRVDAIVNAANSALLGCFIPCHGCIDNAIHSAAGIQLRLHCHDIMQKQGHPEAIGKAKITPGYQLPASYILHTVGPYIEQEVTAKHREQLRSCYRSCLELARQNRLTSIAFCCISTGEFHFPNEEAASIAIDTILAFQQETHSEIEVICNVFKDEDYDIYKRLPEEA